jgi:hypothetical protein
MCNRIVFYYGVAMVGEHDNHSRGKSTAKKRSTPPHFIPGGILERQYADNIRTIKAPLQTTYLLMFQLFADRYGTCIPVIGVN